MATTNATVVLSSVGFSLVAVASVVPVLDTNIYASLDALHTNDLLFGSMARQPGGSGTIRRMTVIDGADQGADGVLHLFTAALANTTHTANAAFAPTDADALLYVGSIAFPTYQDFDTSKAGSTVPNLAYRCADGSQSLYGVLQTLGTPTYGASSLKVVLLADLD